MKTRTEKAALALAHLYVYDCVVSLMEGSPSPRRGGGASGYGPTQRIIRICKKEQQRLLREYDRNNGAKP